MSCLGCLWFPYIKDYWYSLSPEGLVLDSYPLKEGLAWPPQEAFSI